MENWFYRRYRVEYSFGTDWDLSDRLWDWLAGNGETRYVALADVVRVGPFAYYEILKDSEYDNPHSVTFNEFDEVETEKVRRWVGFSHPRLVG